jgi:CRP-like cAMP-binding protein
MDAAMRRHALWIARAMSRSDLTPLLAEDIERLAVICQPQRPPPGTVLMQAGEDVTAVYIVRDGVVELRTRRLGSRRVVRLVRAGDVVGDIPMFCERPMPFQAVALSDTAVLRLGRDELVALLHASPSLSLRWTTSIAKRLEQTQHRLLSLLTKDLAGQVATLLLDECGGSSDGRPVVALSHQTIGQMVGARRPSVSRVLDQLRRQDLIESRYRRIVLLDVAGLALVAGEPSPPGGPCAEAVWSDRSRAGEAVG